MSRSTASIRLGFSSWPSRSSKLEHTAARGRTNRRGASLAIERAISLDSDMTQFPFADVSCAIGGTNISTGFLSISTVITPRIKATSLSTASAPRSRANMRTSCSSLLCSIVFGLIGLPPGLPLWPFANGRPPGRPLMPDMLTTAVPSAERDDHPPYGLSSLLAEVEAAANAADAAAGGGPGAGVGPAALPR